MRGEYGPDGLRPWSLLARSALARGLAVHAYFNNTMGGDAVRDAARFEELVGSRSGSSSDAHRRTLQNALMISGLIGGSQVADPILPLSSARAGLLAQLGHGKVRLALDVRAARHDARGRVVERLQSGGEADLVHRPLGLDEAVGDLVDLAGDELGILTVDRHLGDRPDLVLQPFDLGLDQLAVLACLLEVRQPAATGFQVVLERLEDALPGGRAGHRVGGHAADPFFQFGDLTPDLLLVGPLEELAEHVLGVEQPQVDPEQPVQAGELEVLERQRLVAPGQLFRGPHLLGDLPQRGAPLTQGLEAAELPRRQRLDDPPKCLGGEHRVLRAVFLGVDRVDVSLELGVRPDHADVRGLAGQDQGYVDVGVARQQGEAGRPRGRPGDSSDSGTPS